MPKVELIFDADCPSASRARQQLRLALASAGLASHWDEWDRSDPASPAYARRFGSPTILVDGNDVSRTSPSDQAEHCRLYRDENGASQGVPAVAMILSALNGSDAPIKQSNGWRRGLTLLPAIGAALLPRVT